MLVEVRVARRGSRLASLNRREKHKSQRRIGLRGVIGSATSAPTLPAVGNGRDQQDGDPGRASGPGSENEQGAGGAPGPSGDMARGEIKSRNTRVEVRVTPVRTGVRFSPPPPPCPRLRPRAFSWGGGDHEPHEQREKRGGRSGAGGKGKIFKNANDSIQSHDLRKGCAATGRTNGDGGKGGGKGFHAMERRFR